MKCPNCNHENLDVNKYCSVCGSKLAKGLKIIECPICHQHIPEDSNFCPDCGEKITKHNSGDILRFAVNGVSFNMIFVEHGDYVIEDWDHFNHKDFSRRITISKDYYLGETQVTQGLWEAVMGRGHNPSYYKNYPNSGQRPVENVSWNECQLFIDELNKITGNNFSLPHEVEWEFAVVQRGLSMYSEYKTEWDLFKSQDETHHVTSFPPNKLGFYDLLGNVFEWCQDRWPFIRGDDVIDLRHYRTCPEFDIYGGHYGALTLRGYGMCESIYDFNEGRKDVGFRLALR